jgi:hypothetical protein
MLLQDAPHDILVQLNAEAILAIRLLQDGFSFPNC